jgi:hypothetical protein
MMVCGVCKRPTKYITGRGWVHLDGLGLYWMRCKKCGWQGAPAKPIGACPKCGSRDVRDDHVTYAVDDGKAEEAVHASPK